MALFIQPNVLLMLFRRFNPGTPITFDALTRFDTQLRERHALAVKAALEAANVDDPDSEFAIATVIGTALLAMGGPDQLTPAAFAFKKAVDQGVIA